MNIALSILIYPVLAVLAVMFIRGFIYEVLDTRNDRRN